MRIGLLHEGTLYPLAGEDGVAESVHSSAGEVTIEGNHPTQRVNRVRAANAVFYDRLNLATTVRFSTTRTFSTVAAAELWSLDYDAAMPRTGALVMESTTGTRYLHDAVVASPERRVYGCSVALSYTVQGGLVDGDNPYPLPVFTLGSSYAPLGGDVCTIPTYAAADADGYSAGHPSVVYTPFPVSGYTYWMAHTPLKGGGTADYENPCIVASNDGVTWETPAGITNPIQPKPASGFNADTNLTWDGFQFILLYTEFATNYTIYSHTSSDGITWSARSAVMAHVATVKRTASPSLRKLPGGSYQLWAVNDVAAPNTVSLYTADSLAGPWTETACTFSHVITEMWHLEVHRYNGQYIMLMDCTDTNLHCLLFLTSADGIAWTLNAKFPYAICWNGSGVASYYKSACVFGYGFGDGLVGRLWHTTNDWATTRVADIAATSDLTISETYVADSPLAISAPFVIGDNFTRANGNLPGSAANSGQTWLAYSNQIQIDTNKIKMGAANSYAAIELGSEDGMVGIRLSTFPQNALWELEAKAKRNGAGATIKRLGLYYFNRYFRLQIYNGTTTVSLAQFAPMTIGDGNMDGAEITMEFRDLLVTVRYNGRVMMQTEMSESDAAALAGQTQASLYMGDANTRIDRFFAQT